jgi:hypothetical protein
MKITTTKVIQELLITGWHYYQIDELLIKDVIKIIDKKLKEQKGISIRK